VVDERLDADLADTALPIEVLIQGLCRELGLAATWLDTANGTPGVAAAKVAAWQESPYGIGRFRLIPAADIGLPDGEQYVINTDTGAVFNEAGEIVRTLTDTPTPTEAASDEPPSTEPGPGDTGPPAATAPPAVPTPTATAPPELTLEERAEADRQRRREALEVAREENARADAWRRAQQRL